MKSKRWAFGVVGAFVLLLCAAAVLVWIVDPYFHYHKPIKGMSYVMEEVEYANDGIAKNFDYDAVIIGTSTTWGFSTAEINELFDVESIRLTFPGEGFKRTNENLQTVIRTHPDIKFVIRGIDPQLFVADENQEKHDTYPEYLYDDNIWNDVYYILNGDVLCSKVFSEILRTVKREPEQDFDDYNDEYDMGNGQAVLEAYDRPEKEEREIDEAETQRMLQTLDRSLQKNVIEVIEENPDITFYIFFPPYSILWWDGLNQLGSGIMERRIEMEKLAIEKMIGYENVYLFSFNADRELVCDLDRYVDDIHFTPDVNTQILKWIKDGKYELTEDNYEEYLNKITELYCNFDYDSLFQ